MDSRALALTLGAAGFHALWNLRLHRVEDRIAAMAVASVVAGLVLSPLAVIAFPHGVLGLALLSALAETAYAVTLSTAYGHGSMSVAYPIGRGTAPLLVTAAGIVVLGQHPSPVAVAGAATLGVGLAVVALRGGGSRRAVGWAFAVGCCIATYSVIDARAVATTNPLGYVSVVLLVAGILQVLIVRSRARLRASLQIGSLIGICTVASYSLVLIAFTLAPAGRVSTVREVAVLIGLLAAREHPGKRVWAGAALVVVGAVLAGI